MTKPRLNLRLSFDVYTELCNATHGGGATKSAIIEQALREYFDPAIKAEFAETVLNRMDAFEIRQGEMARDLEIALETLSQFVFYWLVRTEPIAEPDRESANALGQRRYDQFVEQVALRLNARTRD